MLEAITWLGRIDQASLGWLSKNSVNVTSLPESQRGSSERGFALWLLVLFFLIITAVRKSPTCSTPVSEPEGIEPKQVERTCYLISPGQFFREIAEQAKAILGMFAQNNPAPPTPGVNPLLWQRPWHLNASCLSFCAIKQTCPKPQGHWLAPSTPPNENQLDGSVVLICWERLQELLESS